MRFFLSVDALRRLWPHADAALIAEVSSASRAALDLYGINTIPDLVDFIAECSEETGGMTALVENLNYSAERAHQVWPLLFPTPAAVAAFGTPRLFADKVYGGRLGNSPGTDDGYNFRGRGMIQLTGRDWYEKIGAETKLDLVGNPDLVANPKYALDCAAAFWKIDGVSELAQKGEFNAEVKRINGGYINMAQRLAWRKIVAGVLTEQAMTPPVAAADSIRASSTFDAEIMRGPTGPIGATGPTPEQGTAHIRISGISENLHQASNHPDHISLLQHIEEAIENWWSGRRSSQS